MKMAMEEGGGDVLSLTQIDNLRGMKFVRAS